MSGDYTDALAKDIKKLSAQVDKLQKDLKKNKTDVKAIAELKKIQPFITEESLKKRYDFAKKMDGDAMRKIIDGLT